MPIEQTTCSLTIEYVDGKRRRVETRQCRQCSKDMLVPVYRSKQFCSAECSRKYRHESTQKDCVCAMCGKEFSRQQSHIRPGTKFVFCSRSCRDQAQSADGGYIIRPAHYRNGEHSFREKVQLEHCVGCGETRSYLLEVHHIDGDRQNNKKSNLEVVCANCHAIRHLRWTGDSWVRDNRTLTPREQLHEFTGA